MRDALTDGATQKHADGAARSGTAKLLYESATTRVVRLRASGRVRKEALGPDREERIRREREILTLLSGVDGVVQVRGDARWPHALKLDDGGGSLAEFMQHGRASLADVLALGERLARVLAAVHHAGVTHCDVCPSNIVLGKREPPWSPMLIDFGLAEASPLPRSDRPPTGTLGYAAPEQSGRTARTVDHRTDLYSLGATLYELATGKPCFEVTDPLELMHSHLALQPVAPRDIDAAIPKMLSDIILRLLTKEPDRRYQSAEGLAHDLRRVHVAHAQGIDETFTLGEHDFPPLLAAPTTLVGRDNELRVLRECFDNAQSSPQRTLLIEGAPGIGKSALLQELRARVQRAGGLFLYGKFDQYQKAAAPTGGMTQALTSLARQLLAFPGAFEAEHQRLSQAREANPLITALLPGFAEGPSAETPQPGADQGENALLQASVNILRAVVSEKRPVVLALDDLQWAGAISLRIIDRLLEEDALRGLLVVGAHREPGPDSAVLVAALERWKERARGAPRVLKLHGLGQRAVVDLLSRTLRLPHDRARALAPLLQELTSGNPLETLELLNALRHDDLLQLTPEGWTWDPRAVRGFVGAGTLSQRLVSRMAQLHGDVRNVLQAMSCLGTPVDMRLLQEVTVYGHDKLRELLQESAEGDLIVFDPHGSDSVQFRHDLIQQAVLTALGEEQRAQLQLEMARRLLSSGDIAQAAQQYLGSFARITDREELEDVAHIMQAHARTLTAQGEIELAEHYLACAEQLAHGCHGALYEDIACDRHAALVLLARFDEADARYAALEVRITEPERLAGPATVQARALELRGRRPEAHALCRQMLGRLGVHAPEVPDALSLHETLDRALAWVRDLRSGKHAHIGPTTDPGVIAAAQLIFQIGKANVAGLGFIWARQESFRLWTEKGSAPPLAVPVMAFAQMLANMRQDYRAAYELDQHVMSTAATAGFGTIAIDRMRTNFFPLCYFVRPVEACIEELAQVRRRLQGAANLHEATAASKVLACWLLECESLAAAEAEFDVTVDVARRAGHVVWTASQTYMRQWVRMLQGKTPSPPSLEDAEYTEAGALDKLPPATVAVATLWRMQGDLVLGDHEALIAREHVQLPLQPWDQGQPLGVEYSLLVWGSEYMVVALRAAVQLRRLPGEGREERLALIDKCRAWLDARALDQRDNFLHLAHFVRAEQAWVTGDTMGAARAFDAARKQVRQLRRPWHKALITERAALFHLEQGLEDAGNQLIVEAREHYAQWGAFAKVRLLDKSYPVLHSATAPLEIAAMSPLRSGAPSSDMLDLLGILRVSQALNSQRTLRDLAARVAEVAAALTGATRVALLVAMGREWMLMNPVDEGDLRMLRLDEAAHAGLLPRSVLGHVEQLGQPLQVPDVAEDERFSQDPYFDGHALVSLLLVPVAGQGTARAVLYLENTVMRGAFGAQRLDTIILIAGQLAVSLANAQLYDQLEERVRERTAEIEKLQGELMASAHRAGMAQIATNVLHNVGNVLNSVTVAANRIKQRVFSSRSEGFSRAAAMIEENAQYLPRFIAQDPRGRVLPKYLVELAPALRQEREQTLQDIQALLHSVEHIGTVVRSQQTYAGRSWMKEPMPVSALLDQALSLNGATLNTGTRIVREDEVATHVEADRARLLQILVNLISNANEAMSDAAERTLTLGAKVAGSAPDRRLIITVRDSGHGIAPENLSRLFSHGFTTKPEGHGFGLHSAATAAMEMGGKLTAHSDGMGCGATFALEIPLHEVPAQPPTQADAPAQPS